MISRAQREQYAEMSLKVTILRAKDLKACDWLSKNDPFVVTSIAPHSDASRKPLRAAIDQQRANGGSGVWRTRTIDNGGDACEWSESHQFSLSESELASRCVQVVCWDDDGGDEADCIGYAHILLESLARRQSVRGWYVLRGMGRGTPHGSLEVEVSFTKPPPQRPLAYAPAAARATAATPAVASSQMPTAVAPSGYSAGETPGYATDGPPGYATAGPPGFAATVPPGQAAAGPPGFATAPPGHATTGPPGYVTAGPPGYATGPDAVASVAAAIAPSAPVALSAPVANCVIVNPRDIVVAARNPTAVFRDNVMSLESCECLELGLAWDLVPGRAQVDLDAQCVLFDFAGKFVDVVYYNHLVGAQGAVTHSGDDRTGEGDGDDERISILVQRLPKDVEYAVFVVSAHDKSASFASVIGCRAELRDVSRGQAPRRLVSTTCDTNRLSSEGSLILAIFYRDLDLGEWHLSEVGKPCRGYNFQECGNDITKELSRLMPDEVANEVTMDGSHSFSMKKGDLARLPPGCNVLTVGLGWECRRSFDLDAAVLVLRDVDGDGVQDVTHVVNYKNLRENFVGCPGSYGTIAIEHMGDNTTGKGRGDDETIHVRLDLLVSTVNPMIHSDLLSTSCFVYGKYLGAALAINSHGGTVLQLVCQRIAVSFQPPSVEQLVVVVNIFTAGGTFRDVCDAYVRLVDDRPGDHFDVELARYKLDADIPTNGLIFSSICRVPPEHGKLPCTTPIVRNWYRYIDIMLSCAAQEEAGRSRR